MTREPEQNQAESMKMAASQGRACRATTDPPTMYGLLARGRHMVEVALSLPSATFLACLALKLARCLGGAGRHSSSPRSLPGVVGGTRARSRRVGHHMVVQACLPYWLLSPFHKPQDSGMRKGDSVSL